MIQSATSGIDANQLDTPGTFHLFQTPKPKYEMDLFFARICFSRETGIHCPGKSS